MKTLFGAQRRTSRGQMLPIFAGALVLLMAISALVVDLGFTFMTRRQEQNAADPAALAAARYIPQGNAGLNAMWTAACFYAQQNGYVARRTDNGNSCVAGSPTDGSSITVNYPPSANAGAPYTGSPQYVEVVITRQNASFFGGVVGLRTFTVSSSAVAAFDNGSAGASSLVSLNPHSCGANGARLHGGGGPGGGILIFPATGVPASSGGYIQINSDCGGAAWGANDNCSDGGSGGLTIAGGTSLTSNTVYIAGACNQAGTAGAINVTGGFDERAPYVGDPLALVRPPVAADLPTRSCPGAATSGTPSNPKQCSLSGSVTLQPGAYYGGFKITNPSTQITLDPGIYVIAGGGIVQTGGLTAASGRIMIYSTDSPVCAGSSQPAVDCQAIIDFRGSTSLDLTGLAKDAPCLPYGTPGCPFGGMLFWQDAHATGTVANGNAAIEVEGTGSLKLEGTIYSAAGNVLLTGNSVTTGCTPNGSGNTNCAAVQIIADTFDVGGAGMLNMPYDPSKFYDVALKGLVK
jgi:Flp pilus assembly protein TadG